MTGKVDVSVRRLPYSELNDFPSLFQDYCTRYDAVAEYFSGNFRDPEARRRAVDRTLAKPRDRETLVRVLLEQNGRWGLDDRTRENIETLRRPDSSVVITGQQVGIFLGPIYTVLKTITTLQLAEQLSREVSKPVVPVFWLGAEDHDFDEMAGVMLLRENQPIDVRYGREAGGVGENAGPVGRIRMNEEVARLVAEVDGILPPSDFKAELMSAVGEAYRPGRTFADAFALLMRRLFSGTGLVLISSDDERLKRLAAPLFRKEVEEDEGVTAGVRDVSSRLAKTYHEQVQARPANLFLMEEGERLPIDASDGQFSVRDRNRLLSREELLKLIDDSPEKFSPNVVLRPLMQDLLLPTAIYVGGPAEISYFAQYRRAYEWAEIPMPLIYPRASMTILESKIARVLEKYGLDVGDFGEDLEKLFHRVVISQMEVDAAKIFQAAGRHLHEAVNLLKPDLEKIDRTLVKSAESTRAALLAEFEKLKAKVVRAEKHSHDEVRDQLQKAQANLFPAGVFQERALSILYFLNKYGIEFLDELRMALSTDTTEHQVVYTGVKNKE
ncbi:MAG: bacillithiol biosynthesis cysteine-adding enzyme BshC [Rhodothermales bacterium]